MNRDQDGDEGTRVVRTRGGVCVEREIAREREKMGRVEFAQGVHRIGTVGRSPKSEVRLQKSDSEGTLFNDGNGPGLECLRGECR